VLEHATGTGIVSLYPGLPAFGTVSVEPVDADLSDEYFLRVTDFLTPDILALGKSVTAPQRNSNSFLLYFEDKSLSVAQHVAISQDGTAIPYFRDCPQRSCARRQRIPPCSNGYGGFEVSMLPSYRPAVGAAWLEKPESTSLPTSVAAANSVPSGINRH